VVKNPKKKTTWASQYDGIAKSLPVESTNPLGRRLHVALAGTVKFSRPQSPKKLPIV
jgi:hypothetical protein